MYLIMAFLLTLSVLIKACQHCRSRTEESVKDRCDQVLSALSKEISGALFRVFTEFYAPSLISALVNISVRPDEAGFFGLFSLAFAYCVLMISLIIPFVIIRDILREHELMDTTDLSRRYSLCLKGMRSRRVIELLHYPMFFIRIAILTFAIVVLRGTQWL